ncbi:MAG: sugar transferase [Terracidiphilus sp.]
MSANSSVPERVEIAEIDRSKQGKSGGMFAAGAIESTRTAARTETPPARKRLSPWSRSAAKRVFDCACVAASLPLLAPVLLAIGLAVRLTSPGPALYLQERIGQRGRTFTIFKFRTLANAAAHCTLTTAGSQHFTPIGLFLRTWKLDELPQLLNVLLGDMSLVGPRPKLREYVAVRPLCRPGVTGAATIVFACEETMLDRIPVHRLQDFYRAVVLPAKHRLDTEYMARATFSSDLKLIAATLLHRWGASGLETLIGMKALQASVEAQLPPAGGAGDEAARVSVLPDLVSPTSTEQPASI